MNSLNPKNCETLASNAISEFHLSSRSRGFTLVEMLMVMAIMGTLFALTSLGLQSVLGSAFNSEASDIANTLVRARAYAMSNNTYVFVGVQEVDGSLPAAAVPQNAGYGRIGVIVVASNDGTKGYDSTSGSSMAIPQSSLPPFVNTKLVVIAPLHHFENIHMVVIKPGTFTGSPGNSASSSGSAFSVFNLAIPKMGSASSGTTTGGAAYTTMAATSLINFTWPLSGTAQYTFGPNTASSGSIIQFNPQGEASIYTGANGDSYLQWTEMDLVPTHGNSVPATALNSAAIMIDGGTGAVNFFRS